MYELAKVGREISVENIESAVIDESLTSPQTTPDGAMVLIPNRALIRDMVKDLFGGPVPTSVAGMSEKQIAALDSAKIEVQNGTLTTGLAQRTAEYLKDLGYTVVSFSNADRSDHISSIIVDYSGKTNTVSLLAQRFNVPPENVRRQTGVESDVDIRLILGQDYASSSP
jgi:hypothetical protein